MSFQQVAGLLGNASQEANAETRVELLRQVQDLILHKNLTLLENFIEEVLNYIHDPQAVVKKFVLEFIEAASKTLPSILPRLIDHVHFAFFSCVAADAAANKVSTEGVSLEQIGILRRLIQTMPNLYRAAFYLTCCRPPAQGAAPVGTQAAVLVSPEVERAWTRVNALKSSILSLVYDKNEGVQMLVLKFAEMVVHVLSHHTRESERRNQTVNYQPPPLPSINVPMPAIDDEVCLDFVPPHHPLLRLEALREEGQRLFNLLVSITQSQTVSSTNLTVVVLSLSVVARQRPMFMPHVIATLLPLATREGLPKAFATAMVASVHKLLRNQLFNLLKHPASTEYHVDIADALYTLGAKRIEYEAYLRKQSGSSSGKRPLPPSMAPLSMYSDAAAATHAAKRARFDPTWPSQLSSLFGAFNAENLQQFPLRLVIDLVFQTMQTLPDSLAELEAPTPFAAAPFAAATTAAASAGLPSLGAESVKAEPTAVLDPVLIRQPALKPRRVAPFALKPSDPTPEQVQGLTKAIFARTLAIEASAASGGAASLRSSLLARLLSQPGNLASLLQLISPSDPTSAEAQEVLPLEQQLIDAMVEYIVENVRARMELAFGWLCHEYLGGGGPLAARLRGRLPGRGLKRPAVDDNSSDAEGITLTRAVPLPRRYTRCLMALLHALREKLDVRDRLFTRIVIEAPAFTPEVLDLVLEYCTDSERSMLGLSTLHDLVLYRPPLRKVCLQKLLEFSRSDQLDLRRASIQHLVKLYASSTFAPVVEAFALESVAGLVKLEPRAVAMATDQDDGADTAQAPREISEEDVMTCTALLFALCAKSHSLLLEFAKIYAETSAQVKRPVLRQIEPLFKQIGMASPVVLQLLQSIPKGADTLVHRLLHVLADTAPPSRAIVAAVKEKYNTQELDAKFLIPILGGLDKTEILAVLPSLVALPPALSKDALGRLVASRHYTETGLLVLGSKVISPSDVMLALHLVDPQRDNVTLPAIVQATNFLFTFGNIYTQEVLASVLQQLVDMRPIPLLTMRTMLKAYDLCPGLLSFMVTLLLRLVVFKIWEDKHPRQLWDGFVLCCERLKPLSFQALVSLPPAQLETALTDKPSLREPLTQQVQSLPPQQKIRISTPVLAVLGLAPTQAPPAAHAPTPGVLIASSEVADASSEPSDPPPTSPQPMAMAT
ncbi:hypothetical protein CAOG_02696 [Capsaspora owczarzaki ATCC 30864]|uniref:hypothetical protein n=1 Tax=Capsaspora owczarzaki (strain ATCC 30864) TaxID=595528 RepID=UPI00035256A6|nr:hypothetical protein CAOG_02696 [Capsaspora owczarzaki ATCC 30864]|eukprot:XP_004349446.2 hypothetical protein CAOG_02696 [Capsaspora owczarzaki ATCC 30864]